MNKKQKAALGISLALFALTILCAPWDVTYQYDLESLNEKTWSSQRFSPVWETWNRNYIQRRLNVTTLLIEWAAIGIIGGGLVVLFKEKE
ncbi:MAG: hypothetical protein ABMA26_05385 [Limisphaerales bacterium]